MCLLWINSFHSTFRLARSPKSRLKTHRAPEVIHHILLWIWDSARNVRAAAKPPQATLSLTADSGHENGFVRCQNTIGLHHPPLTLISSSSSLHLLLIPSSSLHCVCSKTHWTSRARRKAPCWLSEKRRATRSAAVSAAMAVLIPASSPVSSPHTGLIPAALHLKNFPPSSSGPVPGRN